MLYLKPLVLFVLLALILMVPMANSQDILIIANANVPINSLTSSETKNIFLGRKTDWGNGSKIIFFTTGQKEIHKAFLNTSPFHPSKKTETLLVIEYHLVVMPHYLMM